jgi:hypothetical protein
VSVTSPSTTRLVLAAISEDNPGQFRVKEIPRELAIECPHPDTPYGRVAKGYVAENYRDARCRQLNCNKCVI